MGHAKELHDITPGDDVATDPLRDPALYINRELSQLDFNFRVLAQALDEQVPLLERLRFLCISCTNLDEFFEIRAATVRHAQEFGLPPAPDGLSPTAILNACTIAPPSWSSSNTTRNEVLRPAMEDAGVAVLSRSAWTARQKRWLRAYFRNEIMPVLSPLGLDPAHPFPKILNKTLNIVVVLEGQDAFGRAGHLAIVRARVRCPASSSCRKPVAGGHAELRVPVVGVVRIRRRAVPGMQVMGSYQFRVTRNSELVVDEEEVENLALALRDELVTRGYRPAVRLEIAHDCPHRSCAPCCRISA
ncbi:hypothetical protein [Xanthomonas citri]|uniref:hypothetical protein n=1 Tax=Xanthomonas citri TaxID=346 RepID=UPI0021B3D948|nr:hypothetical protein [Xanthomonas citri]